MSARPLPEPLRGRRFSLRAAAAYLGMSVRSMQRLIEAGAVPVLRTDDGRFLGVYEFDLRDWLTQKLKTAQPVAREDVDTRVRALAPREIGGLV